MDDVDLIITDSNIPPKIAQRIEQMGIELKIVPITENIFE
jgi:DeoR/GlpR family transcriptional regulator of sugar metabolism